MSCLSWDIPVKRLDLVAAFRELLTASAVAAAPFEYRGLGVLRYERVGIPADSPGLEQVKHLITENRLRSLESPPYTQYTEEELATAELFHVLPTSYASMESPEEAGTKFESIVLCKSCGLFTRRQTSALFLRKVAMDGNDIAKTLGDDVWVVNLKVVELMKRSGATGCELRPVVQIDGSGEPLHQLLPTWRLPESPHPSTPFREIEKELCSVCHHRGRVPMVLRYDRQAVGKIYDVGTAPVFYSMNYFDHPKLVFSQRLRGILQENGVQGYAVAPVQIWD